MFFANLKTATTRTSEATVMGEHIIGGSSYSHWLQNWRGQVSSHGRIRAG